MHLPSSYGILAENKLHLSEIAHFLKEDITLKKTIDQLSRNLNAFDEKESVMQDYLSLVKQQAKEDYAVIVIDNSDIAKPASRKLEALSEIRDGNTGEITQIGEIKAVLLSIKNKTEWRKKVMTIKEAEVNTRLARSSTPVDGYCRAH